LELNNLQNNTLAAGNSAFAVDDAIVPSQIKRIFRFTMAFVGFCK
jgi:hypothetical protein